MATKHPRVNVVLERPLFDTLSRLARRDDVSLSLKARELIREAIEIHEDIALARIADRRARTFVRSKSLSHEEVWGRHAR